MRHTRWVLGLLLLASCGQRPTSLFDRGNGDSGAANTGGAGGDLLGGNGGGDAAPVCTAGACVPSAAGPFVRVTMVSYGKPE